MSRVSHLAVTHFTLISADDYLGSFKSSDFDFEVLTDPGRAVSQRHQLAIPKKKRLTWTFEELITASNLRQTNLNITVISVGGTDYLGVLKTGSLKITTDVKDGSGAADLWEYPYAMGTDAEVTGTFQIANTAAFATIIGAAGTGGALVTVAVAFGGLSFTCPATLTTSKLSVKEGEIQTEDIKLSLRGLPTVAAGGTGMLALVALGTAQVTWSATLGSLIPSGVALITDASFTFSDASLLTANYTLANQGAPTLG